MSVICYKRVPTGEIIQERVTPKATGYQKDLYALEHLPEDLCQAIEKDVTADVDNRAAIRSCRLAHRIENR